MPRISDDFNLREITVIADEEVLNGSKRFLAAGFLTEHECAILSKFTMVIILKLNIVVFS